MDDINKAAHELTMLALTREESHLSLDGLITKYKEYYEKIRKELVAPEG